jgi:hypothetical protein
MGLGLNRLHLNLSAYGPRSAFDLPDLSQVIDLF